MLRRLALALLAVALFAGWQEALLHPLEHVDERGQFVHLGGADGGDARGENGSQDPSDRLGDSLAALAACAASEAPIAISAPPSACEASTHPLGAPRTAEAPPFLSQGPPSLL